MSRPTAESIWRSFAAGNKRHLLLTGGKGSGKTTLHRQLMAILTDSVIPGITTWAKAGEGVYLRDNLTEKESRIGIYDRQLPGTENKMRLLQEGLSELGIPALRDGRKQDTEWFTIDEIGYLESGCQVYGEELNCLMNEKHLLACVRKEELTFLKELTGRPDVFLVDLDNPYGNTGCVIMASGMGKRFGGNKLMAEFGGKPLIDWILDATEGIFASRVVVTRHQDIVSLCRKRDIPVVFHQFPWRSDTVRIGIEALELPVTGCLFCPSDQPLLLKETVQAMTIAADHCKDAIWQLSTGNQAGAPVLFPKWAFGELCSLPEGKGGNVLLKKYGNQIRLFSARKPEELMDVDRTEDIGRLLYLSEKQDCE